MYHDKEHYVCGVVKISLISNIGIIATKEVH